MEEHGAAERSLLSVRLTGGVINRGGESAVCIISLLSGAWNPPGVMGFVASH